LNGYSTACRIIPQVYKILFVIFWKHVRRFKRKNCTYLFVMGFLQRGQSASCFFSFLSSTTFLIQRLEWTHNNNHTESLWLDVEVLISGFFILRWPVLQTTDVSRLV
jgi:hypothetical protein